MKRAEIREYVFKLLYCTEFHENEDLQKQYRLYMENLEQLGEIKEIKEKDKEYIINRVTDIVSRIDIPKPVAVDQAVELAKKYGTDDSPSFVNGVLAKLF